MVLVHLLPTAGGLVLSFKRLNTFTFRQLFDAPWAGLENYRAILFDTANPLRDGLLRRGLEHGGLHVLDRRRARSSAAWRSRCCSTARCAASGSCAR